MELGRDVLDVGPERVRGDRQLVADLAGRPAGAQRTQDLELADGERLDLQALAAELLRPAHPERDLGDDRAAGGASRRRTRPGPRCTTSSVEAVFDRKPSAPAWIESRTVSSSSCAVSMITGAFGQRALTARVDLGAGPVGQGVVHQHDVDGLAKARSAPRRPGVGDADHRDPGLGGEQPAEGLGEGPVVVDQEDPDRAGFGRRAVAAVDRPRVGGGDGARPLIARY